MNKKIFISIFVAAAVGFLAWNYPKKLGVESSNYLHTGICGAGEYYSDYSKQCEMAKLQLGSAEELKSYTVAELVKEFGEDNIEVINNPAYENSPNPNKARVYRGVSFQKVIQSLLPEGEKLEDYVVAATCLDGFDPVMDQEIMLPLKNHKGLIAFQQSNPSLEYPDEATKDELWDLVFAEWGIISPGPFYIIWDHTEGIHWKAWPYQLQSLRLIKADVYKSMIATITPDKKFMGAKPKTYIERGFDQVRGKCLTCHSLSGVGGKKSSADLIEKVSAFPSAEAVIPYVKGIIENPPPGMTDIKGSKFTEDDYVFIADYLFHMSKR